MTGGDTARGVFAAYDFLRQPTPAVEPVTVLQAMANHDNNEERRYLVERPDWCLTWSWTWLTWCIGAGAAHDPYDTAERAGAWVMVGPLIVEVYLPRGGETR